MFDNWEQLGVGGLFLFLVLKEVLAFAIKVRNGKDKDDPCDRCDKHLTNMSIKLNELYRMHDQKDSDGVYVWYVRRSLEEAMDRLSENINLQTQAFNKLITRLEERK